MHSVIYIYVQSSVQCSVFSTCIASDTHYNIYICTGSIYRHTNTSVGALLVPVVVLAAANELLLL
jgi:hypothetical protein